MRKAGRTPSPPVRTSLEGLSLRVSPSTVRTPPVPHVAVKMYPGRTPAQKQALAEAITRAVMEVAGSSESSVSVSIEDVAPADWVETVYKPDILARPDLVFKKPGYDPL
jgi:4-oxalocrotonate tautomerase